MRFGTLEIWRSAAGPNADGVLRVILTLEENADERLALTALHHGREQLKELASADLRVSNMLDEFGYRWELVAEYGMGTTLLGSASALGDLVWKPPTAGLSGS